MDPFTKTPRPAVNPWLLDELAIVPAFPDAPLSPVVEVRLQPAAASINIDTRGGAAACSSACGHCGRCSHGSRGNATCADCGARYDRGDFDSDAYCDDCRAQRDAHTDALEQRMAKEKR